MAGRPSPSRRLRAAELFEEGKSQAEVARELEVTRTTAMRWFRAWKRDGRRGLVGEELPGRPRKLSPQALSEVLSALPEGTSVDVAARIIEERTGVHYHPGHVWRILKAWGWAERFERPEGALLQDPDGNELFLYAPPEER